ncbi:hypothetical protein BpHYR1_044889, partial [Brachionus plicatilis]
ASYGFIQRAGTNKYYATADLQMNWIDVENYWFVCGKFMNPSYAIHNGYKVLGFSGYWLGLYKSLETNSWRWIDNSPLAFVDWDKTWPNAILFY